MDYESWSALSDSEITKRDVAEFNLLAALGLPGAEGLDVAALCRRLDDWARLVKVAIKRTWKRRVRGEYGDLTGNQFRILVMVTILQRDLGVRYNRQCLLGEYDARDSRNHFVHGPLTGHGGTCASLPVLYVAIGRRLGFPLYLVPAMEHLFVRWEGEGERFNIEATALGFEPYDDARYRSYPKPISDAQLRVSPHFLRNLMPREELGSFLMERARVLFDNLKLLEAVKAAYFAKEFHPAYKFDWAMISTAFEMVSRMRNMDRNLPWPTLVNLAAPQSRYLSHAVAIATAKEELIRQLTIRSQSSTATYDEFFSNMEKEPVHV